MHNLTALDMSYIVLALMLICMFLISSYNNDLTVSISLQNIDPEALQLKRGAEAVAAIYKTNKEYSFVGSGLTKSEMVSYYYKYELLYVRELW